MEPAAHESTVLQTSEMQEGKARENFYGSCAWFFFQNIGFSFYTACAVLYFPWASHILEAMFIFFLSLIQSWFGMCCEWIEHFLFFKIMFFYMHMHNSWSNLYAALGISRRNFLLCLLSPKAPTTSWPAGAGGTPAARVRVLGDANFRCRGEKIPLAGSARVRGVSRLGLRAEAVASS